MDKKKIFIASWLMWYICSPLSVHGQDTDSVSILSAERDYKLSTAVISASAVRRVEQTAYNAVAIDTKEFRNTTKTLSDALSKAPGIKVREAGGVGSDLQLMMDGFGGKHVKVFIDGVPQEGVGSAFSLNNIPVAYAERIEVYKGVVPVEFGTDALGGVVNIVTGKRRSAWHLDASYAYGSFNTHRSHINFSQTAKSGFHYELNAFQNYSKNNYKVDVPIEDFVTGRIDRQQLQRVERFHDTYHNESVGAKVGWMGKQWADRMMLGVVYAHEYKEIQNGVRQETVFGEKHRHGFSIMPSLEWRKRNLLIRGLSATITANYNHNQRTNVDTAGVKYNWLGETKELNSPGEQSLQHAMTNNNNWNATAKVSYNLGSQHSFVLNYVFNAFHRSNTSLLAKVEQKDAIAKQTIKNITGISYRWRPVESWNLSAFGKFYGLRVAGPVATDVNSTSFVKQDKAHHNLGYGLATTYFLPVKGMQVKASYERALRLPTIEELFGDEDLEQGSLSIRPEQSHNLNLSASYEGRFGRHNLMAEGGFIFRDTRDYIQRNIIDLSGGKQAASYVNYGKVMTTGANIALRYQYAGWLNVGGHFTQMDVRDNMKTMIGSSAPNLLYRDRMPNQPYCFADVDATLHWHNFWGDGNTLSLGYDMQFTHSFTYYASSIGANNGDYLVPNQWAHNLSLTTSLMNGRYNLSIECRNLTNTKLYDNFSLQKPGRSIMAKFRIYLKG